MKHVKHPGVPLNCLLLAVVVSCLATTAHSQEIAGTVTHLSGTLTVKRGEISKLLGVKSEIQQGDLLVTESETYARVKFQDDSEIVLRPQTQMRVDKYAYEEKTPAKDSMVISLLKGGMRAVTGFLGKRSRDNIQYTTPTATIGIRGTNVGVLFCNNDCGNIPTPSGMPIPNGTHADVASGAILLSNTSGSQLIGSGQFGFAPPTPTAPPILVPASQGIQVTMPQSISTNNTGGRSLGGSAMDTRCSP